MKDSKVRKAISLIKSSGFYNQDERKFRSSFETTDPNTIKLEELKNIDLKRNTDLSNEELFDLYQIVASLHEFDNNREQKILYQLRSIKYKPSDLEIRFNYLNNFWNYILDNRSDIGKTEREVLKKEFNKFREYAHMEWGRDSDLYSKCLMILEELGAPHPDESTDKMKNFIDEWERVNRIYRTDEQALDYASQVIYKKVTS